MEKESFKQLLKKADFNKRTFSQYLGLKYQSGRFRIINVFKIDDMKNITASYPRWEYIL
jgi:hypothetical protein